MWSIVKNMSTVISRIYEAQEPGRDFDHHGAITASTAVTHTWHKPMAVSIYSWMLLRTPIYLWFDSTVTVQYGAAMKADYGVF